MSVYRLREGDEKGGISAEGDDAAGSGVPALWMQLEAVLGDKSKSIESRGDLVRKAVVAFLRLAEEGKGTLTPEGRRFFNKVTGRGGTDTARLSEGNPRMEKLLEAERTIDRIGRRFFGVAKNGRDFFRRITQR